MKEAFSELKMYSAADIFRMARSFVSTKLFFPGATLIRGPFHFRGKKGNLLLGKGFTTGTGCRFELFAQGKIAFGESCHIGDYVHIVASDQVSIGNNCLFASKIFISDTSHGDYGEDGCPPTVPPNDRPLTSSGVRIGDNVWIGENAVVLPGVTIGDGCIIGANSTVTRDLPPNTISAGSPAKPIKSYNFDSCRWEKC